MLEVLEPGLLTTVQDAGRPGAVALGVPIGGACDPWSLAVANLLLGNEAGAAALEITLAGPTLAVRDGCTIALAGADLGAHIPDERRAVRPGTAHRLHAGTRLAFGDAAHGLRAYLAVPGGVAVPAVLGSASTCLVGGFGGLDGRALRRGDRLEAVGPERNLAAGRHWPDDLPDPLAGTAPGEVVRLRLLPPPRAGAASVAARRALLAGAWRVGRAADRMGLRLEGPSLPADPAGAVLPSRPVVWGAVQLPPGGAPIVLLADHQTVGGYPLAGVVARADLARLGQLRPGDDVRFVPVGVADAQAALREQLAALRLAASRLAGDPWEALADGAR
jgi:antagonist of KipI